MELILLLLEFKIWVVLTPASASGLLGTPIPAIRRRFLLLLHYPPFQLAHLLLLVSSTPLCYVFTCFSVHSLKNCRFLGVSILLAEYELGVFMLLLGFFQISFLNPSNCVPK